MLVNPVLAFVVVVLSVMFVHGQRQEIAAGQGWCHEATYSPDRNPLWSSAGLDTNVDWIALCGDVVAYKILWSNAGDWSDWFVTGVNDVLPAVNGTQKRMWSLFAQHYHIAVICKSDRIKLNGTQC